MKSTRLYVQRTRLKKEISVAEESRMRRPDADLVGKCLLLVTYGLPVVPDISMTAAHPQINEHVLACLVADDIGQNFPRVGERIPLCRQTALTLA